MAWTLCLLVLSETFRCSSPPPSSLVFIRCNVQMEILCHMFKFQKDLFPSLKSPACGGLGGDGSENAYIFLANCGFFSLVFVTAYTSTGMLLITQIQNRNTEYMTTFFLHSNETNLLLIFTALEGQLT